MFMPTDKQPADTNTPGHPPPNRDQRGQKRVKAYYRKPLLKRLGLLRSVTGSDAQWTYGQGHP